VCAWIGVWIPSGRLAVRAGRGDLVAGFSAIIWAGLKDAVGQGGLSGAPLFDSTLRFVEAIRHSVPDHVSIVGCGGVFTSQEVRRVLSAGAAAVQLYTSFIYEGPGLPGRLARELSSGR